MVRMLCRRSATLITSTRGSRAIAMIILRMVSPSAAVPSTTLSSLVTPSTRCATSSPKSCGQLFERVAGVLDGVVQQCRHEGGGVHTQLGQNARDGQRMGDVRVAGLARLARMAFFGDVVGTLEQRQVGLRIQLTVEADQRFEHRADGGVALTGDAPGQPSAHPAGRGRRHGRLCRPVAGVCADPESRARGLRWCRIRSRIDPTPATLHPSSVIDQDSTSCRHLLPPSWFEATALHRELPWRSTRPPGDNFSTQTLTSDVSGYFSEPISAAEFLDLESPRRRRRRWRQPTRATSTAASRVPPVARTSSMTRTCRPVRSNPSAGISRSTVRTRGCTIARVPAAAVCPPCARPPPQHPSSQRAAGPQQEPASIDSGDTCPRPAHRRQARRERHEPAGVGEHRRQIGEPDSRAREIRRPTASVERRRPAARWIASILRLVQGKHCSRRSSA